mmetsp:Transcript_10112/g.25198  ORF Transcript_10112/g.25198 Transcript_10112/m.25198 type:complete len:281 (-) Transcript_10112:226-1068(-)
MLHDVHARLVGRRGARRLGAAAQRGTRGFEPHKERTCHRGRVVHLEAKAGPTRLEVRTAAPRGVRVEAGLVAVGALEVPPPRPDLAVEAHVRGQQPRDGGREALQRLVRLAASRTEASLRPLPHRAHAVVLLHGDVAAQVGVPRLVVLVREREHPLRLVTRTAIVGLGMLGEVDRRSVELSRPLGNRLRGEGQQIFGLELHARGFLLAFLEIEFDLKESFRCVGATNCATLLVVQVSIRLLVCLVCRKAQLDFLTNHDAVAEQNLGATRIPRGRWHCREG